MDVETKVETIKNAVQELVSEQELKELFETNSHPIAYDGFEPSGMAHLAFGVYRPLLVKEMIKTGVKFKLLLADSFAWINDKMGGDLERIRVVGKYFIEVWKAAGIGDDVEFVWHKENFDNPEYWKKVLLIGKNQTLNRTMRAMQIAGRKENEIKEVAGLFYPSMQTADVFQLDVDICQLGMDQRRASMLAREIADKLKWKKPVAAHHLLLLGLDGISSASASDENKIESEIEHKMSKSRPETGIFINDSEEEIQRKIMKAYCPQKIVEGNPLMQYSKELIFRGFKSMKIERKKEHGGDVEYFDYTSLEKDYLEGKIHPLDLKNSVSKNLNELIKPIREHFEKNSSAKELYEQVKQFKITR
jgi:tyrosyl-tRNA synthetase